MGNFADVDLTGKAFCVFGLRGSGKSYCVHYIAKKYGRLAMVYDYLDEYPADANYHTYSPKDRKSLPELEGISRSIMTGRKYKLFIIDEANRFCPSKPAPLPSAIADINDLHRHFNLAVGYVARRPVQLNQDLTELAEYLFIFHLKGKSDIHYLNDITDGLGDAVLSLQEHYFVVVDKLLNYRICKPLPYDASYEQSTHHKKIDKP